ncbi:MAG: hypothetical protein QW524_01025 [Candidatus Woesearchaeota archaeon]
MKRTEISINAIILASLGIFVMLFLMYLFSSKTSSFSKQIRVSDEIDFCRKLYSKIKESYDENKQAILLVYFFGRSSDGDLTGEIKFDSFTFTPNQVRSMCIKYVSVLDLESEIQSATNKIATSEMISEPIMIDLS